MTSVRWVLREKWLMPRHFRLARLRAFYWAVLRRYETELCQRCGGRVRVVFHVPDAIWEEVTGNARSEGGEAGGGVLCVPCVDELYEELRGRRGFLRWTCAVDDSVMTG